MKMLRSKLVEREERQRREEIAARARRGPGRQLRLADPLLRAAPLHDGQGPPHRLRGGRRPARARRRPRRLRPRRAACGPPATRHEPASSRPRRTSTPSSPTGSAARGASTSRATRAAPAPTPGCARRSATARWRSTSRRTSGASTSGPRRRPTSEAERLAAEAYGAARTWFLTNGATQGNHALCLALAPLGTQRRGAAQLARVAGRRARAVRRAPALRRARVRRRARAWRTASRPGRWREALEAAPDARAAFIVSPTYYGMAADVEALRAVAHAAGRAADRRPVVGPALRLPRGAAAQRAGAGRRRRAHLARTRSSAR